MARVMICWTSRMDGRPRLLWPSGRGRLRASGMPRSASFSSSTLSMMIHGVAVCWNKIQQLACRAREPASVDPVCSSSSAFSSNTRYCRHVGRSPRPPGVSASNIARLTIRDGVLPPSGRRLGCVSWRGRNGTRGAKHPAPAAQCVPYPELVNQTACP